MRFLTPAGALAIIVASMGTASQAYTLQQAAQPAERPPAGYSKDVYVDSRGCAYVRANIGTAVNWVPRLSSDRKTVICGMTPSAAVATLAAPPAPPAPPPAAAVAPVSTAPVTTAALAAPKPAAPVAMPMALAAPMPVAAVAPVSLPGAASVSRTLEVNCPADGSSARVRIGRDTVRVSCPPGMTTAASQIVTHGDGSQSRLIVYPAPAGSYRVADMVSPGGRVVIGGLPPGTPNLDFGNGYGITSGYPPVDPVPQASYGAPAEGAARAYVPPGYRPAWDDDRLNPYRGPRTAYGDAQMSAVLDTTTMPMKPARRVATRTVVVTQSPVRTVIATKGQPRAEAAPVSAAAPTAPATAPLATGVRYIQVGAFGVASNAQNAVVRIKRLGLGAATSRTGAGLTLVLAGPFRSTAEMQRALAALRSTYPDAYIRG